MGTTPGDIRTMRVLRQGSVVAEGSGFDPRWLAALVVKLHDRDAPLVLELEAAPCAALDEFLRELQAERAS